MRAAVDTGALLALANPRDQHHERAVATARTFLARGGVFVGSTLVLAELHGHLLRWRTPVVAAQLLRAVTADRAYAWRDATAGLIDTAVHGWIDRFPDQRFSLTDAVTFELMRRERLKDAFAFDQNFLVAGFRLLD